MSSASEHEREWTIREYQEGDEEQILQLRGIALSGSRNKEWWKWMFRDGPAGPAIISLAVVKQRIIAQMASIWVMIQIGDKATRGTHGVDLMVHPDYRRQGVFTALGKKGQEDLLNRSRSITYGTPNDQSRPGFVNRLNALPICEVPLLVKVIDWGAVLKQRYKFPALAGKILGNIWERITNRKPSLKAAGIIVEEVFSFDEQIDKFWEKASRIKNIMIIKDMKYLNWRYIAKPGHEYRIFLARKQDEIAGYVVLKLQEGARSIGYIIDFLTLPGEDNVAELLITIALRHLKAAGAAKASCWMLEETPYYGTLRKLGFIRRHGPTLCSRIVEPSIPKEFVTNPANWYYVMGDDDAL